MQIEFDDTLYSAYDLPGNNTFRVGTKWAEALVKEPGAALEVVIDGQLQPDKIRVSHVVFGQLGTVFADNIRKNHGVVTGGTPDDVLTTLRRIYGDDLYEKPLVAIYFADVVE